MVDYWLIDWIMLIWNFGHIKMFSTCTIYGDRQKPSNGTQCPTLMTDSCGLLQALSQTWSHMARPLIVPSVVLVGASWWPACSKWIVKINRTELGQTTKLLINDTYVLTLCHFPTPESCWHSCSAHAAHIGTALYYWDKMFTSLTVKQGSFTYIITHIWQHMTFEKSVGSTGQTS